MKQMNLYTKSHDAFTQNAPPIVSIIMPVYNEEKYVKNTIHSILNNTNEKEDKNSHGAIYDDFYHTGYFNLMPTNEPGYFYFTKKSNQIKNKIKKVNIEDSVTIFIAKIKE